MNSRHALLVAAVAGAWCLTPSAHASSNNGQGHGSSQINSMIASPSNTPGGAAQGFTENGDTGMAPGAPTPRVHGTAPSSSANCDQSGKGNGAVADCASRGNNAAGSPGENGQSGLGWQSLLPGSIQS